MNHIHNKVELGGSRYLATLPITDLVTGNLFLQLVGILLLAENAYLYPDMGGDKVLDSSPEGKQ
tara:strand:- start:349 stop:540 length:192 start_codon:yes stop_codon:yes gene_type:complete